MTQKIFKNILALLSGVAVALLIFEIFLRIYNPIPVRIKGGDIVLPVNRSYVIKNTTISKLDAEIKHTKNSLGFRGDEPPEDLENHLSIIVIGGSTAESYYISDNKTWPYLLEQDLKKSFPKVWINNAGFDGHSTFGHQILLDNYIVKIKPKEILFLTGVNDIERNDLNYNFDDKILSGSYIDLQDYLAKRSEVANLVLNLLKVWKARNKGLSHADSDVSTLGEWPTIGLDENVIKDELEKQKVYLESYKKRLQKLVKTSKDNGIDPILITQPALWGAGKDPQTGADLAKIKINGKKNGELYWRVLESYNEKTREVGEENVILVIDLAKNMPKDSAYFYDGIHFTNEGSKKVAEIINKDLTSYLKNKFKNLNL